MSYPYACPVYRDKENWYYSTNLLYPIIRDIRSYTINKYIIEKAKNMNTNANTFFIQMANLYFRHLLDICKSEFDSENLSSLLSAIEYYMIMLQITDLAYVHLKIDSNGIQPSYNNIKITDRSLIDKDQLYRTF